MMSAAAVPPPGTWQLSAGLEAAAQARRLTNSWLAPWASDTAEVIGDLVLAVSELTANAAAHGAPPIMLTLSAEARGEDLIVTAAIHDSGTGMPRVFCDDVFGERGRGLAIVQAITGKWGVREATDGGKDVWCEVAVPGTGLHGTVAQAARDQSLRERITAAAAGRVPAFSGEHQAARTDISWPRNPASSTGQGRVHGEG
jgi:anti-sigma regulatory factor (Ser/Thr protein kinase)